MFWSEVSSMSMAPVLMSSYRISSSASPHFFALGGGWGGMGGGEEVAECFMMLFSVGGCVCVVVLGVDKWVFV